MGLYSLSGTITRLGQSEFNNDVTIYAFVEITDAEGVRTLLKKVAVAVDVEAAIGQGVAGQFYFDEVFVFGRRYFHHCAIAMTCRQLAMAGRYLAHDGKNPTTGLSVISPERYVDEGGRDIVVSGTPQIGGTADPPLSGGVAMVFAEQPPQRGSRLQKADLLPDLVALAAGAGADDCEAATARFDDRLQDFDREDFEGLHDRVDDFDEIQRRLNGFDAVQIFELGGSGETAPVERIRTEAIPQSCRLAQSSGLDRLSYGVFLEGRDGLFAQRNMVG